MKFEIRIDEGDENYFNIISQALKSFSEDPDVARLSVYSEEINVLRKILEKSKKITFED